DPKPLSLHLHQTLQRGLRGGIAEGVLDRLGRTHLPDGQDMPAARFRFDAIPKPQKTMESFDTDLSFGPGTNRDFPPKLWRLSRRPGIHSLAGALCLQAG